MVHDSWTDRTIDDPSITNTIPGDTFRAFKPVTVGIKIVSTFSDTFMAREWFA